MAVVLEWGFERAPRLFWPTKCMLEQTGYHCKCMVSVCKISTDTRKGSWHRVIEEAKNLTAVTEIRLLKQINAPNSCKLLLGLKSCENLFVITFSRIVTGLWRFSESLVRIFWTFPQQSSLWKTCLKNYRDGMKNTDREICLLFYSPDGHHGQDWGRLKPGILSRL